MSNRVCLAATELHPFTSGGIGVLYANLIDEFSRSDVEIIFLYAGDQPIDCQHFAFRFPHARLVVADDQARLSPRYNELPGWAFSSGEFHRRSFVSMLAIEHLLTEGASPDWVEFQDHGGLAAATLAERVVNPSFLELRVSVRIHGTEIALRHHEPRLPLIEHVWVMDLEQIALERADLVVCHTAGVQKYTRQLVARPTSMVRSNTETHDHDRQTWLVQTPPILGRRFRDFNSSLRASAQEGLERRHIVFASKVQDIKRPEVFVRGCAEYFATTGRDSRADALILTTCDADSRDALVSNLADEQKARFRVVPLKEAEERMRVFSESIVVIPGPYESLCLLAFEAAACGAILVVNEHNPAFDDESLWVEGVNALKFDGTSKGLARTLAKALRADVRLQESSYVPPAPEAPYWLTERTVALNVDQRRSTGHGTVGVVVTNHNLGEYLGSAVRSIATGTRTPDQLIIVDDASSAPGERSLVEQAVDCARESKIDAETLFLAANRGLAAARNEALTRLTTDYVLFLDADDILAPQFIDRAAKALDTNPLVDAIVPQVAFFWDESEVHEVPARDYAVFIGDTSLSTLVANRLSSATCLARRRVVAEHGFSEDMSAYEDWDLWVRMRIAGAHFVPDHRVGLWYRQRPDSMAASARGGIGHPMNLDRLRSHAQTAGARVDPSVLTDATHPVLTAEVLAAKGYLSPSESLVMRAELERLAAVEEQFRTILGRKAVTMAMRIADSRHILRTRKRQYPKGNE